MKKIEVNNLPAGSIVLLKRYNLFQRLKAKLFGKELKYNDAGIDPIGNSQIIFENSFWIKNDVFVFKPKKQYGRKEIAKLFDTVLPAIILNDDPVEAILTINLVRPNTFSGSTLEELLDNNKYYVKQQVK